MHKLTVITQKRTSTINCKSLKWNGKVKLGEKYERDHLIYKNNNLNYFMHHKSFSSKFFSNVQRFLLNQCNFMIVKTEVL